MLLAGGDDKIFRLFLLQHQPLHFNVIPCMAPVAQRIHVAEIEAILQADFNASQGAGDFAGNKGLAAHGRLMVEQNAIAGIHAVGLAIVDRNPVGIELGHCVGRARIKRRLLRLWNSCTKPRVLTWRPGRNAFFFRVPGCGSLQAAEACPWRRRRRCIQAAQTKPRRGSARQDLDLIRLHLLHNVNQAGRIRQVAIVQNEV